MIGLPYLDKFCFVQNRQIKFKWYQKEHKVGQVMNFNSASPNNWKKSIVIGGYKRIAYSCSDSEFFKTDVETFHKSLFMNGYPESFISSLSHDLERVKIERFQEKTTPRNKSNFSDRKKITAKFPFHSPDIHNLIINLKHKLSRVLPETNFHFIITSFKLDNLFSKKRAIEIPTEDKASQVYSFRCPCAKEYIGETSLTIAGRLKSHINQNQKSNIKSHVDFCPEFQREYKSFLKQNKFGGTSSRLAQFIGRYTERIKYCRDRNSRRFIEALEIRRRDPVLNAQKSSKPLDLAF